MTVLAQWTSIADGLARLRAQQLDAHGFSLLARGQQELMQALPERYALVLCDLLDRLEAGASFSEESCSFSQQDLHGHLQSWLDKARERL